MSGEMARACISLLVSIGLLAGCSRDEPRKVTAMPAVSASNSSEPLRSGEALFKQYCAVCHPDGGNASDPERPLYGSVLQSKRITSPDDIVKIMRNPLSRMIRFDPSTLSDKDARAIAEYILETFK
jgi:cytochrome c6